ncbi:MAG: molybdenum cofactor guanylyltransferase [Bacteroidales bacterium]|nr:molybdenum cofactor guanylyltransferase [Bacteroidales bacterium]
MTKGKERLTGVVLAGGKSSRFGQDKGLYQYDGKPLVEHALDILRPVCHETLISTNHPDEYSGFGVRCITDHFRGAGPLAGIHSALMHARTPLVAVIGCDMPNIPSSLFSTMLQHAAAYDVVMPVHQGFTETMCALYSKKAITAIEQSIRKKEYKIITAISSLKALYLPVEHEPFYRPGIFQNINYRSDL